MSLESKFRNRFGASVPTYGEFLRFLQEEDSLRAQSKPLSVSSVVPEWVTRKQFLNPSIPDADRMYRMVLEHAKRSQSNEDVDDFEIARSIK
jgi:hypothetical protein